MVKLRSMTGNGRGIGAHSVMASVNASIGMKIKRMGEEVEGRTGSLMKSLIPSAIG